MTSQLATDSYQRGGLASRAASAGAGPQFVGLILFSLALIVLSRLDHSLVRGARLMLVDGIAPMLKAAIVPFSPVQRSIRRATDLADLQNELDRLRAENQTMKSWEVRAKEADRRMAALEGVTKVAEETRLRFLTARVLAESTAQFGRTTIVDVGAAQGIKAGYPVVNGDGVVGRITSTGSQASRLLLLHDSQSRIPVHIGPQAIRAVMAGDNTALPTILSIAESGKIEAGHEVVTSGIGGLFPRGLKIGIVIDTGESLRVELASRLDQLEYVSIVFHENLFNQLAAEEKASEAAAAAAAGRRGRRPGSTTVGENGASRPAAAPPSPQQQGAPR